MSKPKPLSEFVRQALDGRTQADLAGALGVSRSTVQRWASGKTVPPESYRASLRSLARSSGRAQRPAPAASPARPTVTRTPLPAGNVHVQTHSRTAFARELDALRAAGHAPRSFSVLLHGFKAADSPLKTPARRRRVTVTGLTPDQLAALASGDRAALEDAITGAIQARNYSGGFSFTGATRFSFDSTP